MSRPLVLFGPHGVGKAARLRTIEGDTFDFGNLPAILRTHFAREASLPESPFLTFAALSAHDLPLHHFHPAFYKRVVMLPPRELYLARRQTHELLLPQRSGLADNYYVFAKTAGLYEEVWDD